MKQLTERKVKKRRKAKVTSALSRETGNHRAAMYIKEPPQTSSSTHTRSCSPLRPSRTSTSSDLKIQRKMKAAGVFVLLACLLMVHVQGQAKTNVRRCLCQGPGVDFVHPKRIDRIELYPQSASCENVEMIVVLKKGKGKVCLNPESRIVKDYLERTKRQKQESAE